MTSWIILTLGIALKSINASCHNFNLLQAEISTVKSFASKLKVRFCKHESRMMSTRLLSASPWNLLLKLPLVNSGTKSVLKPFLSALCWLPPDFHLLQQHLRQNKPVCVLCMARHKLWIPQFLWTRQHQQLDDYLVKTQAFCDSGNPSPKRPLSPSKGAEMVGGVNRSSRSKISNQDIWMLMRHFPKTSSGTLMYSGNGLKRWLTYTLGQQAAF